MIDAIGYAAKTSSSSMKPMRFTVDRPAPNEVRIDVLYCGVCHSDIHQVRNDWGNTVYPCLPGHEIVGRVAERGSAVTRHQVGDIVGVGCMIDSCHDCPQCQAGEENYCTGPNSWLATYNGPMKPAAKAGGKNMYGRDNTFGGYSTTLTVREEFALKIPASLKPEQAAPILCAGVTTYSPLRHWKVGPGQQVGVVGLGGLGHMAVKLARAMGAEVTVFTSHKDKRADAQTLGAREAIREKDTERFEALAGTFDFILSTVPEEHDLNPFVPLLKHDGAIVVVGALAPMKPLNNMPVAFSRITVAGSLIGSLRETQEVLDFCAEHGIAPDIQLIGIDEVDSAFKHVERGDVRFRYVIDGSTLAGARAG